ncbi:hypothetical protein SLA2020_283000 [Shorea laevis]
MASSQMISPEKPERIENELFEMAMKGEWDRVVQKYRQNTEAHKVKITRSGDTALHIAVSDGKEEIVEELVDIISSQGGKEVLKIKNGIGNTPLHVAASMGKVGMCQCIAQVDPSLVGARNDDRETPFFLAALHGKKDAFLCLLQICGRRNGFGYSRRNNGETILHVAIAGDYFDLAFQIIHLYSDKDQNQGLVSSFDLEGFSPLHLLASKPSAFRSGSHHGRYYKIIYHCSEVTNGARGDQQFPSNYVTCFEFVKLTYKAVMVFLGLGSTQISKIYDKKQKHLWSVQIMNELLGRASMNEYGSTGTDPAPSATSLAGEEIFSAIQQEGNSLTPESSEANQIDKSKESEGKDTTGEGKNEPQEKAKNETTILIAAKKDVTKISESIKEYFPVAILDKNPDNKNIMLLTVENKEGNAKGEIESPILIAAKNGITEIVEKILELFPIAIHDMNSEKKNVVLLAVEHRQPHVYQLLLGNTNIQKDSVFRVVDKEGNSALHLAAKLGGYKPWLIPGAALQMQWEIKWYEFVKESMKTPHFFPRYNKERKTPKDLFTETHKDLVEKGGDWLNKTSESCSVVAALIATVAFATSSTVPGGVNQEKGTPTLENQPAFNVFAISSLVALCFSVTAVVMFLAILTSRYQERDFGHFFVLKDELKYAAFPVYGVTCLPVTFFAMVQFPLYFDLIWATFKKVPQRSYNAVPL